MGDLPVRRQEWAGTLDLRLTFSLPAAYSLRSNEASMIGDRPRDWQLVLKRREITLVARHVIASNVTARARHGCPSCSSTALEQVDAGNVRCFAALIAPHAE